MSNAPTFAADHPVTDAHWNMWPNPAAVPTNLLPSARYAVRWELERCADWTGAIGVAARRILIANPYPAFAIGSAYAFALA